MTNPGSLQVTTPSDREIVLTRSFNAPRRLVFDAMSRPDLLQRWLGSVRPTAWREPPVCAELDP